MQKLIFSTFLSSLLFLLFSCSNDDEIIKDADQGKITISFAAVLNDLLPGREAVRQQIGNIPECSGNTPAFVEVVVTQANSPVAGTFDQPLRLAVSKDSKGNYFTEESAELELVPGEYLLEFFRVLNEDLEVIWIAPREEEGQINFADMVHSPLPMEIDLRTGTKMYVNVDVICYDIRLSNYYSYLFPGMQANQVIEFCVFGNYCDEDGRHAEAIRYVVSVWNYSGNDSDPKGAILHENLESGIIIEDDFENQESVTFAVPVCITLPDSPGFDQYYFEITLLDGVGYGAADPLIRRGVISEEEVRSLFEGDDRLVYYHFREGNCNLDDSPNLFEVVSGQSSVVEAIFLPTLQDYYAPRGRVEWVHQYNEEGLLIETLMYESFPYRLLSEFNYSDHNQMGLPHKIDRTSYNPLGQLPPSTIHLTYSGDNTIQTITTQTAQGISKVLITDYDFAYRITESHSLRETGEFISRNVRQFDSEGRLWILTTYSSETGTADGDITRREIFYYTSFGEIDVLDQFLNGLERQIQYFYREDNTLKEMRSITYEEEPVFEVIELDENEVRTFISSTQGDFRNEYISFFENGYPHIEHFYQNDLLYRIITNNEDGSSAWKIIEEDSSYRIEYKDGSGNIYRTEYYNFEGELISEGS